MTRTSWPKEGDVLFSSGEEWTNNAHIYPLHGADRMDLYVAGYREGAELLAGHMIKIRREKDTLIYPTVFLWRHYTELRLKSLIHQARLLKHKSPKEDLNHRMPGLWHEVRQLLREIGHYYNQDSLGAVDQIIDQFDEIDASSFVFRYPTSKDGAPSLPPGLRRIDIPNLDRVMKRLSSFLDSADELLTMHMSSKEGAREGRVH